MKTLLATAVAVAALAATLGTPVPARAAGLPSTQVAWQAAAVDADIERAFALARADKKPVLLYWGATWCPPCNQLKATLFNRQDFAALSRSFVAVHVDGDRPGAQKLGKRFKVSGYPTLVLFSADGQEITRLPGEADAPQVMDLLRHGLAGGRPLKAVLGDALAGKKLGAAEWRMLAFYSWATDEQTLVPKAEQASTLVKLALASPAAEAETQTRLWLKALAASDDGKGVKPDDALRQRVQRVLADPAQARTHADVLLNYADEITAVLEPEGSAGRVALVGAYDAALRRLQADGTLSRSDRLQALIGRIDLARLGQPKDLVHVKLAPALLAELRQQVARDDREISDGYERQAVITAAAYALGRAGLWADSEALLRANLAKSHSPYYLMSQLGSNARKLGKTDEALRWYAEAFDKSVGPATRLQWGAGYLNALVDLAPQDAARIEKAVAQLLAEAAQEAGSFDGRSARSLQRVAAKLAGWNADGRHDAVIARLQGQLEGVCAKLDAAERATCGALLKNATGKKAA